MIDNDEDVLDSFAINRMWNGPERRRQEVVLYQISPSCIVVRRVVKPWVTQGGSPNRPVARHQSHSNGLNFSKKFKLIIVRRNLAREEQHWLASFLKNEKKNETR
jgi:hypothetical protein